MNVLLVMPKVPYAINDWNIPPVGIAYVSSSMKAMGLVVHNLNLSLSEYDTEEAIQRAIEENNIDVVATGDLVVNYQAVKEIVDIAKNYKPNIITIIGGGLVTHSPIEAMELIKNADYGVIGEGEITDGELVKALEYGRDISEVDGIIYRNGEEYVITNPREEIEDIDIIPWPDYEGFQYFELIKKFTVDGKITAALTTSRACPFQCTFCSTSGGRKYRQRSLDSIFEELDYLVVKYGVSEIFLNDELFAVNEKRVDEFCERIKTYHLDWHVMLRIGKQIQLPLLLKMRDAGCLGICYGLESADNNVLKSMKKGTTVEEMLRVLEITKKAGINVRGGFIFGDVAESYETADRTMNWIEEHVELLENVSISPIVLYPGSALYEKAIKERIIPDAKEFIAQGCPLKNVSEHMTDEEYNYLVGYKIPEFSAKYRYKIAMLHQEKYHEKIHISQEEHSYIHSYTCKKCNNTDIRKIYPGALFQYHIVCEKCGEKYDLFPNYIFFSQHENEITEILRKKGTAIWGVGETTQALYNCNSYFRNENILIYDSNIYKQENGFYGKKVYSPEMIQEHDVKTIICSVGNVNYLEIKRYIQDNLKKVEQVVWINNILLEVQK